MSDIYSIASVGLLDGQKRLETISQNAANASVPGFKRQVAAARSFAVDLAQAAAAGHGADAKTAATAIFAPARWWPPGARSTSRSRARTCSSR